uniref:Uncharacterized protein n=1 Tax=Oryza brachyantha TaxID=4533 RepID=J3MGC0_ORYBR
MPREQRTYRNKVKMVLQRDQLSMADCPSLHKIDSIRSCSTPDGTQLRIDTHVRHCATVHLLSSIRQLQLRNLSF